MGNVGGSYYPPEFRHFRTVSSTTSEAKSSNVTSKTDIFHLGLILWLLAENVPRTHSSPMCMREGCNAQVGPFCDKSHVHPIALPRLPESIPQYYRDIVDACRAEDPNNRPTAWRLLELFPSTSKSKSLQIEASKPESMDMNVLGKGLIGMVNCNHCRKRNIQPPFFHCNVCQTGDFDICQACHNRGMHCYNRDHFLVEMRKIGSWTVAGKYHSSVKSSGNRDIIEL
jgi:serine/threonine protein kinase